MQKIPWAPENLRFKEGGDDISRELWVPFWGPHNKDYSILGSILGYPNFGKLAYSPKASDWFGCASVFVSPFAFLRPAKHDLRKAIMALRRNPEP